QQIGFDTNPVSPTFGNANAYTLLLAPAERCDLIVDFSQVPAGSKLILYSDAPAPFPSGDPLNDYFTGDPDQTASGGAATTLPGKGPNTRTLMQFRVGSLVGVADGPNQSIPQNVALGLQQKVIFQPIQPLPISKAQVRRLTLNEDFDYWGRLIQRLGTVSQNGLNNQGLPTWGRKYQANATEMPKAGALEIWEIYNLTGDTHPIHFHLVNVQVLARQPFDAANFNGAPVFTGPARPPDANEGGWKETVRMNPNEMTRIIMKFDL
ncbi:MAG: multicopper oxidase domain-containing protein, partial [Deltaproteobacteria bacterium]|nr:multicopper oxidase domain-containing protein [Deltaproteobacteria bacterium]